MSSYEISADFTQYTLTIREGIKWSDGVPVTTEDVRMTFELYGDERIYPSFPIKARTLGRADGTPGQLTIIDELTFRITFDTPLWSIPSGIVFLDSRLHPALQTRPLHQTVSTPIIPTWLKIRPILDELEMRTWEDLVILKDMRHWELYREHGVGVPSLTPWIAEEVN